MINFIIELSRLTANIRWIWKKIFGVNRQELEELKEKIKEGYALAKTNKDPSHIADAFNNRK